MRIMLHVVERSGCIYILLPNKKGSDLPQKAGRQANHSMSFLQLAVSWIEDQASLGVELLFETCGLKIEGRGRDRIRSLIHFGNISYQGIIPCPNQLTV